MRTTVTPEEITSYRENGFVVLDDFLAPDELEHWRATLEESLRIRADFKMPTHIDNERSKQKAPDKSDDPNDFYSKVFVQRINLWMDCPNMRALILDPGIGRMACDLEGIEGVRVWHDQTLIKAPWANHTAWHLDNPYWSFHSPHALSIWVALDDVTVENGCLYFMPGSHKNRGFDSPGIGQNMNALFAHHADLAECEAVPAPMKAGSCSFHNGLTAHAAGPNMTPRYRRAMTCAFMPVGSTFNGQQNVLPKGEVARLQVGDVLDNDELNPVVFQRETASV
jgi:ectoine hydroxylase-related dioxygenase (phytanoyl-CoA dioxygenase family)